MVTIVRRARQARAPLTREHVLQAAVRMADTSGIESLSMRKLALSLGVEAMSLYNHVANKEDVLDNIIDIVVAEIEVPAIDSDWQSAMRRSAVSAHEVLLQHPWAAMLIVSRINLGPAMLRYINATIGCLREAGFSYDMVGNARNAVDNHIYGFTLQELNFPLAPTEYGEGAQSILPSVPADEFPHMHAFLQRLVDGTYKGGQDFTFGLDLILGGLEAILERIRQS